MRQTFRDPRQRAIVLVSVVPFVTDTAPSLAGVMMQALLTGVLLSSACMVLVTLMLSSAFR